MTQQESVIRIGSAVDKLIARCDEIAVCSSHGGARLCNLFTPREARKSVDLMLDFISVIAQASSMGPARGQAPRKLPFA